jgi:hypothetical protein
MTKIQIALHDGSTITSEMEYNAVELANSLNDPKLLMVTVGDVIVNKNAVKMIAPITQ